MSPPSGAAAPGPQGATPPPLRAQLSGRPATPALRLRQQLRQLPAFRALLRSVEEALVEEALEGLLPPGPGDEGTDSSSGNVLDLGCGDGHFGARALVGRAPWGADPDWAGLAEARGRGGHRALVAALADALPWPAGSLDVVVANSVLEHIPDLGAALEECSRLLRPGGRLVITAPGRRFTELLGIQRQLRRLGLRRAARRYGDWFNERSRHCHLLTVEEWSTVLSAHGLRVERSFEYFPPRAQRAFELLHYLGLPALVCHRLTGRWVPWRNPITLGLAVRWLAPLAEPVAVAGGACVFLVAVRER